MDRHRSSDIFLFERFRFDLRHGGLFRVDHAGIAESVAIGSRALELLGLLLERHGQLVSKDELMDGVWPEAAVEENNLTVQMSSLRRILDQDRVQGSCIQTLPGRGYRFIMPVSRLEAAIQHRSIQPDAVTNVTLQQPDLAIGEASGRDPIAGSAVSRGLGLLAPLDRPAVVVLPFTNISCAMNQERFSDEIAEDINTALSRYHSTFIMARNSSLPYREPKIDKTFVARSPRVRYVVEGSMRVADMRIHTTCRLVDTETDTYIWSERYDRDFADFSAVRDEIIEAVSVAVASGIAQAEQQRAMRKPERSLTAWSAYQRGVWYRAKMTAEDITLAEHYFQRAIELDPIFAGGYRGLALARLDAATQFQKYKLEIARASAETLAAQAIALDRTDAEARSAFAAVLLLGRGDHEGARTEAERALALTPRLASAHGVLGSVLTYSGEPAKGLVSLEMSIRLDPTHPLMAVRLQQVAAAHYFCGDHVAAIEAAKHAIHSYPRNPQIYRWLAAALVRLGRISEAKQALANVVAAAPASFDMYVRRRVPWMRPRDQANLLNDLAKAGWRYN